MRSLILVPLFIAATACATPGVDNRYAAELEALTAECQTRGGIVTPTNRNTGQARADYTCRIDTATRLQP